MSGAPENDCYGLRFFQEGCETRLMQIAGSGRLRLECPAGGNAKQWWARPPVATWETYRATAGQTYASRELAESVARRLSR
jgi:hypothetical protein